MPVPELPSEPAPVLNPLADRIAEFRADQADWTHLLPAKTPIRYEATGNQLTIHATTAEVASKAYRQAGMLNLESFVNDPTNHRPEA